MRIIRRKMDMRKEKTRKQRKQDQLKSLMENPEDERLAVLFAAIENSNLDKVKSMLDATEIARFINSKGALYLTPLEIAMLTHNQKMVKLLLAHGAADSGATAKTIDLLREELRNNDGDSNEKRGKSIRRMLLGWEQMKRPDPPAFLVEPVARESVLVTVKDLPPTTCKVRVQWSTSSTFDVFTERLSAANPQHLRFVVSDLAPDRRYYFRASVGNLREWSSFVRRATICAGWSEKLPSDRIDAARKTFDSINATLQKMGFENKSSLADLEARALKKRNAIQLLFNSVSGSKFQKNTKRGVYLAVLLYSSVERTVFTVEDSIPVVQVCEATQSIATSDFLWLMKISLSWFCLKSIRENMTQTEEANATLELRKNILNAIKNLQSALGVLDLGQLHFQELRLSDEAIVLALVKQESPKAVASLNSRWIAAEKIKKGTVLTPGQVEELISFHETAVTPLPKGLYMGHLSLQSSVSTMFVTVARHAPNILPHCKIRDTPYVCREEWAVIQQFSAVRGCLSEVQLDFVQSLQRAAGHLLQQLDKPPEDLRFYTLEVIELNADVAFIVVCPKAESFCQVMTTSSPPLPAADLLLPLQHFELIQAAVYQSQLARKFMELSCTLEIGHQIATQLSRGAFSASEVRSTKHTLAKIGDSIEALKSAWRRAMWLTDLVRFAQDKSQTGGTNLRQILEFRRRDTPRKAAATTTTTATSSKTPSKSKKTPAKDLQANVESVKTPSDAATSILQIYPAYITGLPNGTSLKIRVSQKTSAEEICHLVVRQCNMAAVLKGKEGPIYGPEELPNFCLVAVIGSRERCLRDDYKPLQLQNPWKKGRLYVRRKNDPLAALEQSETAI